MCSNADELGALPTPKKPVLGFGTRFCVERKVAMSEWRWIRLIQEGHDVPAEAPVGEGAPVRAVLVEDEAAVGYPLGGLPEQLRRVEAVAPPPITRVGARISPSLSRRSKASSALVVTIMPGGSRPHLMNSGPESHNSPPAMRLPRRESVTSGACMSYPSSPATVELGCTDRGPYFAFLSVSKPFRTPKG